MSKNNKLELEKRIHNFLERKLERFPEIASMDDEAQRANLTVKTNTLT